MATSKEIKEYYENKVQHSRERELVSQIRELQKNVERLTYEQHLQLSKLIDKADAQNLCWW